MRRLIAAAESLAIDYGGISIVSRATGVSRRAIARGIVELGNPPVPFVGAIRKPGGGRKSTVEHSPTIRGGQPLWPYVLRRLPLPVDSVALNLSAALFCARLGRSKPMPGTFS